MQIHGAYTRGIQGHLVAVSATLNTAGRLHVAGACDAVAQQTATTVTHALKRLGIGDVGADVRLEPAEEIKQVDRTTRTAANTVNDTSTYNAIAEVLGLPRRAMRYGRKILRKTLTALANGEKPLSRVDRCRPSP